MGADTIGAIAGVVGGVAGIASLVWTVVWAVTLRPRVRWSLNRISEVPRPAGSPATLIITTLPRFRFHFRNTGTAAADDAHAVLTGEFQHSIEFPNSGRLRVEPGEEIVVEFEADYVPDMSARRPYIKGTDDVLQLRGVLVDLRWRRQTAGLAKRRFYLWTDQMKVPLV